MQRKSDYNLGNVVAEGVMRAAADRLFDLGKTSKDIDTEALCVELRKEARVAGSVNRRSEITGSRILTWPRPVSIVVLTAITNGNLF